MLRGFIALLNTETNEAGQTVPIVPAAWSITVESANWLSLYRSSGVFFHLRLMVDGNDANAPGKAVYAACGENTLMRNIWDWCVANSVDVWTISQLRADGSLKATRIKNAWKDDQKSGTSPTLLATMAGFEYTEAAENTLTDADL